jgi:hypothetical protein
MLVEVDHRLRISHETAQQIFTYFPVICKKEIVFDKVECTHHKTDNEKAVKGTVFFCYPLFILAWAAFNCLKHKRRWRVLVNTIINPQVPLKAENILNK